MAKRIRVFMPNGLGTISIWDNELDKFLDKGYKTEIEKKSTRSSKKKDVIVEEQQPKENEEWQHMSEQAE
tara:strand:- start:1141 stop:1350 length:210 start_codon:yes stop_codon:yes gene_type:complete